MNGMSEAELKGAEKAWDRLEEEAEASLVIIQELKTEIDEILAHKQMVEAASGKKIIELNLEVQSLKVELEFTKSLVSGISKVKLKGFFSSLRRMVSLK